MIAITEASLRQIQEAMEDEHRKDREALERLMRFLPKHDAPVSTTPTPRPLNAPKVSKQDGSIQSAVECLFLDNPSTVWTTDSIYHALKERGVEMGALRPKSTIAVAIRKLQDRRRVLTVRSGAGRVPHQYRAAVAADWDELPKVGINGQELKDDA